MRNEVPKNHLESVYLYRLRYISPVYWLCVLIAALSNYLKQGASCVVSPPHQLKGKHMTISLDNVGSGFKRSVINDNFDTIESEINTNVLTKDGGKALTADLDFNGNELLNAANLSTSKLTLSGEEVESLSDLKGEQGDLGPEGPQGIQGTQGPQGVQGASGVDGSSFTVDATGLAANRSSFDNEAEGFSYLATDVNELYIREGAVGNWSSPIVFGVGPQGPQGIQGIQGPTGPQGIQGPTGATGATGAAGTDGADGTTPTTANSTLVWSGSASTVSDSSVTGGLTVGTYLVKARGTLNAPFWAVYNVPIAGALVQTCYCNYWNTPANSLLQTFWLSGQEGNSIQGYSRTVNFGGGGTVTGATANIDEIWRVN